MSGFGSNAVECPQRKMVIMSVKKTGLGTPVISGSCSNMFDVVDNGVGDYNINPKSGFVFAQVPEVVAMPTTDNIIVKSGTVTALAIQILTENLSGVATEGDFHMMVIGSLARDLL